MKKDDELIKKLDENVKKNDEMKVCTKDCECRHEMCECNESEVPEEYPHEEHIIAKNREFYKKVTPNSITIKSYSNGETEQRRLTEEEFMEIYHAYTRETENKPLANAMDAYAIYMNQFDGEKHTVYEPMSQWTQKLACEELNSIVNSYFERKEADNLKIKDKKLVDKIRGGVFLKNINPDKELGIEKVEENIDFACPYNDDIKHCNGRELILNGELPVKDGMANICPQCKHYAKSKLSQLSEQETRELSEQFNAADEKLKETQKNEDKPEVKDESTETIEQYLKDKCIKSQEQIEAAHKKTLLDKQKFIKNCICNAKKLINSESDYDAQEEYVPKSKIEKEYGTCGLVKLKHPVQMVFDDCLELQKKKDHDYTYNGVSGFDRSWEKMGLKALWLRLNDKFSRFESFVFSDDEMLVKEEKIEDTLTDMINYAAMGLAKLKGYDEDNKQ